MGWAVVKIIRIDLFAATLEGTKWTQLKELLLNYQWRHETYKNPKKHITYYRQQFQMLYFQTFASNSTFCRSIPFSEPTVYLLGMIPVPLPDPLPPHFACSGSTRITHDCSWLNFRPVITADITEIGDAECDKSTALGSFPPTRRRLSTGSRNMSFLFSNSGACRMYSFCARELWQ